MEITLSKQWKAFKLHNMLRQFSVAYSSFNFMPT